MEIKNLIQKNLNVKWNLEKHKMEFGGKNSQGPTQGIKFAFEASGKGSAKSLRPA